MDTSSNEQLGAVRGADRAGFTSTTRRAQKELCYAPPNYDTSSKEQRGAGETVPTVRVLVCSSVRIWNCSTVRFLRWGTVRFHHLAKMFFEMNCTF